MGCAASKNVVDNITTPSSAGSPEWTPTPYKEGVVPLTPTLHMNESLPSTSTTSSPTCVSDECTHEHDQHLPPLPGVMAHRKRSSARPATSRSLDASGVMSTPTMYRRRYPSASPRITTSSLAGDTPRTRGAIGVSPSCSLYAYQSSPRGRVIVSTPRRRESRSRGMATYVAQRTPRNSVVVAAA